MDYGAFESAIEELSAIGDIDAGHLNAESMLSAFLHSIGYGKTAELPGLTYFRPPVASNARFNHNNCEVWCHILRGLIRCFAKPTEHPKETNVRKAPEDMAFRRSTSLELEHRLAEPRQFMQIILGPRQTGKTTAVQQALEALGYPAHVAIADSATPRNANWLEVEWMQARRLATNSRAVLFVDEVQKVKGWTETAKRLWDEDSWEKSNLHVVLSGSSSLLLAQGVSESLMGRHEIIRSTHWDLREMNAAFGYSTDDYLMYGGYPGTARLRKDPRRWKCYMRDSIIEATISKDVLQMERVKKPALMRALFELGAQYSAQEISYRKLLGQLDDRGNTATIKNYLDLLARAGMMSGLQKFDAKDLRSRASSPRLLVHDPSLMTSSWRNAVSLMDNPDQRGHLVETAVGASLLAWAEQEDFDVYWWREADAEVDYVLKQGSDVLAIEVKSGRLKSSGIGEFCKLHQNAQPLVIGSRNAPLEAFLSGEIPLF